MKLKAIFSIVCLWFTFCVLSYAGTVTYIYTDPQGTPLAEADEQGNITATFDYAPYGTTGDGNGAKWPRLHRTRE